MMNDLRCVQPFNSLYLLLRGEMIDFWHQVSDEISPVSRIKRDLPNSCLINHSPGNIHLVFYIEKYIRNQSFHARKRYSIHITTYAANFLRLTSD